MDNLFSYKGYFPYFFPSVDDPALALAARSKKEAFERAIDLGTPEQGIELHHEIATKKDLEGIEVYEGADEEINEDKAPVITGWQAFKNQVDKNLDKNGVFLKEF